MPSNSAGGVSTVCRYNALEFAKKSAFEVVVVRLHDDVACDYLSRNGVREVSLALSPPYSKNFMTWLHNNPCDVIVSNDVSWIEGAFASFPPQTKHILYLHDTAPRHRKLVIRTAECLDAVVCVATHVKDKLLRDAPDLETKVAVSVIHNGAEFPSVFDRIKSVEPLKALFLGRPDSLKGIDDMVKIARDMDRVIPGASIDIVGGKNDRVQALLKSQGLDKLVRWHGKVPHEQCYDFVNDADVLLLTSRSEPFGMVTIEAMSMGCIPIAYDIRSGSREIISNGEDGFLIPTWDKSQWVKILQTLDADRVWLSKIAHSAISSARTKFTADRMASNLEVVINSILEHKTSSRMENEFDVFETKKNIDIHNKSLLSRFSRGIKTHCKILAFKNPIIGHLISYR